MFILDTNNGFNSVPVFYGKCKIQSFSLNVNIKENISI